MRIRPPELETSIYDVKYHVSLTETPRKADRNKSDHGKRRRTAERGGAWAAHYGRPR
ncbi:hypothetical protein F511_30827 [Dorcoceras hygrometricum]|uniref:Uncharacterized protein n=1 Tax=Dorcoceras hygrometricum TaxID=472368 RepID=A0A2Z7BT99_9LAMI|nr:hypothetical protein F511_30827 [Dorcoceras hygrometricum]